jgi:PDZ domain
MKQLEKGLHAHFEALQNAQNSSTAANGTATQAPQTSLLNSENGITETPFAKVNSVAPGSPGEQAGLKAGDVIRSFGTVNWVNNERLTKVGEVVQQNEGVCKPISRWANFDYYVFGLTNALPSALSWLKSYGKMGLGQVLEN